MPSPILGNHKRKVRFLVIIKEKRKKGPEGRIITHTRTRFVLAVSVVGATIPTSQHNSSTASASTCRLMRQSSVPPLWRSPYDRLIPRLLSGARWIKQSCVWCVPVDRSEQSCCVQIGEFAVVYISTSGPVWPAAVPETLQQTTQETPSVSWLTIAVALIVSTRHFCRHFFNFPDSHVFVYSSGPPIAPREPRGAPRAGGAGVAATSPSRRGMHVSFSTWTVL